MGIQEELQEQSRKRVEKLENERDRQLKGRKLEEKIDEYGFLSNFSDLDNAKSASKPRFTMDLQFFASGEKRTEKYSDGWQRANMEETIKKLIPDPVSAISENGKKIEHYSKDGLSKYIVVEDISGLYYRIVDKTIKGRRIYVNLDGSNASNVKNKRENKRKNERRISGGYPFFKD